MKRIVLLVMLIMVLISFTVVAGGRSEPKPEPEPAATKEPAKAAKPAMEYPFSGMAQVFEKADWEKMSGMKLTYSEHPNLAKDAALAKLEDRLPENPLVVLPARAIGTYGGTFLILERYTNDMFMQEFLVSFSPDFSAIVPNVASAWDASPDAREYTFYLRKGMKWSDGHPFTADDFLFAWNDCILNEELYPTPPAEAMVAGEPGVMTRIEDYTIKISFSAPNGAFLETLASWRKNEPFAPAHHLKKFHPAYTPMEEIQKEVKARKLETWQDLFMSEYIIEGFSNTRPQICAWTPANPHTDVIFTLVRNPYYWKVDVEGQQLPYIDRIDNEMLEGGAEAYILRSLTGDVDLFLTGGWGGIDVLPLAVQKAKENDLVLIDSIETSGYPIGKILFNFFHKDPVLKEIFRDKNFRIALSHAINREEMNKLLLKNMGKPTQQTFAEGPPYFGEKIGKQYLEFDLAKSNRLLDEMGLDKKDSEGYRLRSDGKRLRLQLDIPSKWVTSAAESAELYKGYFKEIGIEIQVKVYDWNFFIQRLDTSEHDLAIFTTIWTSRPMNPLYRHTFVPIQVEREAVDWGKWFVSGGKEGEEPPDAFKRFMEIREEAIQTPDEKKRNEMIHEMGVLKDSMLLTVGALWPSNIGSFQVISGRLQNVPDPSYAYHIYNIPAQYFFKE